MISAPKQTNELKHEDCRTAHCCLGTLLGQAELVREGQEWKSNIERRVLPVVLMAQQRLSQVERIEV